jgi:hypothetical protein
MDWHSDKLFARSDSFVACVCKAGRLHSCTRKVMQSSERTTRHSADNTEGLRLLALERRTTSSGVNRIC